MLRARTKAQRMLRRDATPAPTFRRRHIALGVDEADGSWAFAIDGREPRVLGPERGSDMADALIPLRLINTLCLSDRQLDKGRVFDVGVRPRRGVRVPRPRWRVIKSGLVSSRNEALRMLGEAKQEAENGGRASNGRDGV